MKCNMAKKYEIVKFSEDERISCLLIMENFKFAIVEIKIGILENGFCFYYYFSC